jgi:hypothetical protein
MVFVEGDDYRQLRRPGDDPARFRSPVRPVQVPVAPDSVVHQYLGQNFTTSGWTDSVGNADMSVTGVSKSTLLGSPAGSGDGVDDIAIAPKGTVETLPGQSDSFGLAFTFSSSDTTDNSLLMGCRDSIGTIFQIMDLDFRDGSNGELAFRVGSNGNALQKETDNVVFDGTANLAVLNKRSNDAQDMEIYIGTTNSDLQTPVPSTVRINQSFDHTNYSMSDQMGFFAQTTGRGGKNFKDCTLSFIEFNEEPYSQQEREELFERVNAFK